MMKITSPAFVNGQTIPFKYAKAGENVSPRLQWTGVPRATRELALVCDDPDAPGGTFTHWIIYGIDPKVRALPEGIPSKPQLKYPLIARQGLNSAGDVGYVGPYPPAEDDWHHYRFRLYALKHNLGLNAKVSEEEFHSSLEGNVLASAELVGRYHTLKRLNERPQFKLSNARESLGILAASTAGMAARFSTSFGAIGPAKPLVALALAAVAGGVIGYLRVGVRQRRQSAP